MNKFRLMASLFVLSVVTLYSQTTTNFPDNDKNDKPLIPRPNPFLMYSPNDLQHNTIVLPGSGTNGGLTANTLIVPTGGATALSYFVSCTQVAKVTVNVYTADDIVKPQNFNPASGTAYTLFGSFDLATAIPAAANQIFIGTELAPTVTAGTIPAANIGFRLPQAAVSFSETNAGVTAGTCTDRLMVKYN